MSICKIAAGSGAGLGHRAVGAGPALGVEAQPVSTSNVSASDGVALRRGKREGIRVLLGGGDVAEFLEAGRSLVLERGGGTQAACLGNVGAQLGMGRLLAV